MTFYAALMYCYFEILAYTYYIYYYNFYMNIYLLFTPTLFSHYDYSKEGILFRYYHIH